MNMTLSTLIAAASKRHLEKNKPDLLISTSREFSGLFDFYKAKEIIELGRYEAKKILDKFEREHS